MLFVKLLLPALLSALPFGSDVAAVIECAVAVLENVTPVIVTVVEVPPAMLKPVNDCVVFEPPSTLQVTSTEVNVAAP